MKKYFFARLTALTLLLLLPLSIARAQDIAPKPIEFLPENIFSVSYQFKWSVTDSVAHSGIERASILQNKLSKQDLDNNSVDGSIDYQSLSHYLSVQYGWSPKMNIGLTIPHISRERNSDITGLNSEGEEFAQNNADLNSEGVGDIEIWGLWRLIYSDNLDFHFGLSLNADNGAYSHSEKEELSLGSGANEISAFLKWRIYSIASTWAADIKVGGTISQKSEKSDSDDVEYSTYRANDFLAMLSIAKTHKQYYFGGSLIMENRGETTIDDNKQHDGHLGYSYQLFLNYSDLFLLEASPVNRPWEIQIVWEQLVAGHNAPQNNALRLGATAYF